MYKIFTVCFLLFLLSGPARAGEGMWIPLLLGELNLVEMQEKGFELTAEDVYSVNAASMKDAVVVFGGGCTGSLISEEGLLITNHHCGYSAIQRHSSVEHDYLTNGFWAMSREEELPNEGLKATFLRSMEEVTASVLKGVTSEMTEEQRREVIAANSVALMEEAVAGTHFTARVESFFAGNQYFLFVNEVFDDVRLVGAPPSAIGKFGGDTDNWMWPRHTGDFALFRVYVNENNAPSAYAETNVPYQPRHYFPVSSEGVKEGDFTMVFGYPGSTAQYVPSWHLQMLTETVYPHLIRLRDEKLEVMRHHIERDRAVRIQYAAKHASVSNSWKRWRGEIRGLEILDAVNKKQEQEAAFRRWLESDAVMHAAYGSLLEQYARVYARMETMQLGRDYLLELIGRTGMETLRLAGSFSPLLTMTDASEPDKEALKVEKERLLLALDAHFKDFHQPLDVEMTVVLLKRMREDLPAELQSDVFALIDKKFGGDVDAFVSDLFQKTMFTDRAALVELLQDASAKKLQVLRKDPSYRLYARLSKIYHNQIVPEYSRLRAGLDSLDRHYMRALQDFEPERRFYPDANFTLRVSYGQVRGYEARDAVDFRYYTTIDGIMEKNNPEIYDYDVPARLQDLYAQGDFGDYAREGHLPVCFVASNHTTGGNSGSPVVNSRGHLIGVNFDRAWEGVMSDLMFNPDQCRNISVDMRYVLFIIDKFAGAAYLFDEMEIIGAGLPEEKEAALL